jgi:hypothetical protein
MKRLKRVLEATLPDITSMGGSGRNVDRDQLVSLLRKLASDLGNAFWLRSGVALVILCLLLAITWRHGDQPMLLAGAVAGMGITFVGALFAMKQVLDEMARVEVILTLASDLSLESLTEVARRIVAAH